MSQPNPPRDVERSGTALARNVLGVPGIVFLVLAAVAPLTGMVVIAGIGIAVGNGGGMPAAFVAATVVLLLFAVGYAQMSKVVTSAGGFYAFVVKGLGKPMGLTIVTLAIVNFSALAGSDNAVIARLPWLLLIVLVAGLGTALWLKRNHPQTYYGLDADLERPPTHATKDGNSPHGTTTTIS